MEQQTKTAQGEAKELRTAFASPQFMKVLETLKNAQEAIESLSERYEKDDKRREALTGLSETIRTDFYGKLSEVIGSDFVECTLNVLGDGTGKK